MKLARKAERLVRSYRVEDGHGFRLRDHDPADTAGIPSRQEAEEYLHQGVARLAEMQELLYAQDRWAILLIFQAMDAAGKDSAIKHVMSGINPQGCQVFSFKVPSAEELEHDFLWRTTCRLPERGRIGIFNRSYYEEVLVVRVHPELLQAQKLPRKLVNRNIWKERCRSIAEFEGHLARNGTVVRKFFLNVSRKEQRKRFLERLTRPEKHWKFSVADAEERRHWASYMDAYEDAIRRTAAPHAPWFVVPADHKWVTRLVVAAAIVDALERLGLTVPKVVPGRKRELEAARRALERER